MLGTSKKQICESIIRDSISRNLPLRTLTTLSQLVLIEAEDIRSLDDLSIQKETATAVIKRTFDHLRNLYNSLNELSDIETIKKITKDMQFSVPLPKKDETIFLGLMAHLMLSAISRFNSIVAESDYFLEETYLELKRLKADNNLFPYKNEFSKKENELFQIISKKIVEPYYDIYFDKMKSHFIIGSSALGLYYQCDIPLHILKEFKEITETLKKQDLLIAEVKSFKENFGSESGWFKDNIADLLELNVIRLTVFSDLIKKLNEFPVIRKENIKKGTLSDFFPNIKAIFLLRENLDEINNDLELILSALDKRKKELTPIQSKTKSSSSSKKRHKKHKKERANPSEEIYYTDDSVSQHAMDLDPISNSPDRASSSEASSLAATDSKSEECIFLSKEAEKEEEEPEEKQEEIEEKSAEENLPLYSYHHAKQQEAEARRFSSKAEKIIEDIFDESKKINYYDLVNFIKNTLNGEVDSKTKSSSRKLILAPGQTVFMHQRHGRDRKDYVPVETVKALKIVLQNLGITPKTTLSKLTMR